MENYTFSERTSYESGFSQFFMLKIVPLLKKHEPARKALMIRVILGIYLLVGLGITGVGIGFFIDIGILGVLFFTVGFVGPIAIMRLVETRWQSTLKENLVPVLFEFYDYSRYGDQQISAFVFCGLGLVPTFTEARLRSPVSGTHEGISWAMTEATLYLTGRWMLFPRKTRTVFEGILIKIRVDVPAPLIHLDRGWGAKRYWYRKSWLRSHHKLERFETGQHEFDELFSCYSEEPHISRNYLGDRVFLGLKEIVQTEPANRRIDGAAFDGNWFYIVLSPCTGFIRLGSIFKPLYKIEEDFHQVLADLELPRKMINKLAGR